MCPQEPIPDGVQAAYSKITDDGDLSDWMSGLPSDLPLAEVTMPGTHNSASYAFGESQYAAVVAASRCQSRSLAMQLRLGIRFFDLRVRPDGLLCHGPVPCDLSLEGALKIFKAFLTAHPGEILLVRIKDEVGSRSSAKVVDGLVRELAESAEYPLFLQMRLPLLKEVRGRIVLLCEWSGGQLGLPWAGDSMRIQDEYWQNSGTKKFHIVKKHFAEASPSADLLHVHFTSATNLPRKLPVMLARRINPLLVEYLRTAMCNEFLGVVAMDFPSPLLIELVVRRNRWRSLEPCRRPLCQGPQIRAGLDNLQCELHAAATRADIAQLSELEDSNVRSTWLAKVYTKLLVGHVQAELDEPAVDEPVTCVSPSGIPGSPPSRDSVASGESSPPRSRPGGVIPPLPGSAREEEEDLDTSNYFSKKQASASTRKRPQVGFMYRLSARCLPHATRRPGAQLLCTSAPTRRAQESGEPAAPNCNLLADLRGELAAAATCAEAADLLEGPGDRERRTCRDDCEELATEARWLSRMYPRQAHEALKLSLRMVGEGARHVASTSGATSGCSSSDSDSQGSCA